MRFARLLVPALVLVALTALPAHADLTAFIGAQTSPSTRSAYGVSVGSGFLFLGFEFEYARAGGDDECQRLLGPGTCAPTVRTGMLNVLLQTPRGAVPKTQLYGTLGGGVFRERFDAIDVQETGWGTNVGGGAKIEVAGPLRVRLDYRVFKFTGDAIHKNPQRFSVGLNLAF
jgi:opacity protein-like surface antigen